MKEEQWYKDLPQYEPIFSYADKKKMVERKKREKEGNRILYEEAIRISKQTRLEWQECMGKALMNRIAGLV